MKRIAQLARGLAPYVGVLGALVLLRTTGLAQTVDLVFYDLITYNRAAPSGTQTAITLIGIAESDIKRFSWPIDDGLFCQAIDTLNAFDAAAIGFDLYRDKGVGAQQQCLRDRFRDDSTLISIANIAAGIGPVPETPPERQSYNDLTVDADGVLRRDLLHVTGQDAATVSFPMRVMEVATGDTNLREAMENGTHHDAWLSADGGGYFNEVEAGLGLQRLMQFHEPGSFRQFTLAELLDGDVPSNAIAERVVLIGSTAPSLRDLFETPHSRFRGGTELFQMSGVEVHANRVASLLASQDGSMTIGWIMPGWGNLLLVLSCAAGGLLLGERVPNLRRSVLTVSLAAAGLMGALTLLLMNQHVWIGATMPATALIGMGGAAWLRRGAISQQHSQQIRRLLGQTTSPAVAQQLWNQREELLRDGRFEGQQLLVTVLFTDTADFTSVSELLNPRELMDWLNRGMAVCVPAVTRRGGMVNKFTGDGMLAVFGVPVAQNPAEEAAAAIGAAEEIQRGLERLNRTLREENAPPMRMRIGISSGEALVGSMGSTERIEYAVIGDSVNCASRLESFQKSRHQGVIRVLVSQHTIDLLSADMRNRLQLEPWGPIQLKGRDEPISVSELRWDSERAAEAATEP